MALFTRRVLQQCLNEANSYASQRKIRDWVKKLNSTSERNYIATEWEIVLLHTHSKIGNLTHPEETPKHATLDAIFDCTEHNLAFGADIVAISDRGARENHPIHQLHHELERRFRTLRLERGGFSLRVEQLSLQRKGTRPEILLPKREHFNALIFNEDFEAFVERIRKEPEAQHVYRICHKSPRTVASIFYDPRLNGASYLSDHSYISTMVVDHNALYNALMDKADHLERAGYSGHQGIIVCDAGAHVLTEKRNWDSFCNAEVVHHFLEQYRTVEFVLTLGLEDQYTSTLRQKVVPQLIALREQPWLWDLSRLFDKAVSLLPKFDQSPENAYRDLEYLNRYKEDRPHIGGMTMTCGPDGITEIRMSTRTLLDLLAGRISQERFIKYFSLDNGVGIFESILRNGRLITEASVKRLTNEDDDEIVLTFGKPDAAAGPFVLPQRSRAEGATALPKAGV